MPIPLPSLAPLPQTSKPYILAQRQDENQFNKFADFNKRPKGWGSVDNNRMHYNFNLKFKCAFI